MTPFLPTVLSVSPRIEVANVELLTVPYPGYRITLRNLGTQDVSNVHVQSYRGQDKALSAIRRSDDGRSIMQPGASYTFDMNLTSGRADRFTAQGTWTPSPIDLIEFDSVRWADGTYEGTPPFPQVDAQIETDSGTRLQLRLIIDALREMLATPTSDVDLIRYARSRLNALPDAEPDQLEGAKAGMHATKAVIRADFARFERDGMEASATNVRDWLTAMLRRYEAWLTRLSPP